MKITVNQLRRIINEEVRRVVEASRTLGAAQGPAVNPEIRGYAREIAEITGQGRTTDYLSVAQIAYDFLNYKYWDDDKQEQSEDPVELISDELGNVMRNSGGKLDFDGLAAAQEICDVLGL